MVLVFKFYSYDSKIINQNKYSNFKPILILLIQPPSNILIINTFVKTQFL